RRDDPTRTTLPHVTQSENLSVLDAARLAGVDPMKDKYLAIYREALQSWFFVRDDRTAVALRRSTSASRPASNQTTPPAYEWIVVPLPKMDQTAPEEFGIDLGKRFPDFGTRLLLRLEVFSDIIEANPPDNGAVGIGDKFIHL